MPLTPFHFGPGFLVKAIFPRIFSFRVFILVNVIIDFETLYFILTDQWPLHRFFHTYLGGTFVALLCVLVGKRACYWLTDIWNKLFKDFGIVNSEISNAALISASFVGSYSHVLLDSIMHRDVSPFAPFANSNQFLKLLNFQQLHFVCVFAGVLGVVVYFVLKKQGIND